MCCSQAMVPFEMETDRGILSPEDFKRRIAPMIPFARCDLQGMEGEGVIRVLDEEGAIRMFLTTLLDGMDMAADIAKQAGRSAERGEIVRMLEAEAKKCRDRPEPAAVRIALLAKKIRNRG